MAKFFSLQHSFSCILDVPPLCVLLSHSVCSSDLVGQYTWRAPSDNTINDVHEYPEACDWVSMVEIGLISYRISLNLVNGGASLTTILGTSMLAALVGYLVCLWGCVPSPPGEPLPCAPLDHTRYQQCTLFALDHTQHSMWSPLDSPWHCRQSPLTPVGPPVLQRYSSI